jgi:putative transposase
MTDLSQIDEQDWNQAQQRAEILRPLAELEKCPRHLANKAATQLKLSVRQIYTLIKRLRQADGAVTVLLPNTSNGGRGKQRLPALLETQLRNLIEDEYLTPQKCSVASFVRTVRNQLKKAKVLCPSESTIRRRLRSLSVSERLRRNEVHPEITPIDGATPPATFPLDWIQIDHTPVDIIIVDPIDRMPIGRPYLTIAIDVFSRCIAGFYLSLEAPSATSVGLCLTHVISDKQLWLKQRNIDAQWSIQGKPQRIGVDNATEFHSAAFERGCAQHGIAIEWRPLGQPHFGGIVERIVGTLMQLVHTLPGTTFSNPTERANYNSDKTASLTLAELERWLAVAIAKYYHLRQHSGLDGDTPLSRYEQGIQKLTEAKKTVPIPRDPFVFLIDFLPAFRRSLQRNGITIDHITYYNNALRSWIQTRDRSNLLLIRRDPRDLSKIFVLDETDNVYLEVPYRTLSRPSITLWEHKLARKRLREQKQAAVNEENLFAAIDELRNIECEAKTLTRSMRRNRARRQVKLKTAKPTKSAQKTIIVPIDKIKLFDDIETW